MAALMKVMYVAVIAAVLAAPLAEAAISCSMVIQYMRPCLFYLTNRSGPLGGCCNGVRGLYNAARTTSDRQSVCGCLKKEAGSYKKIIMSKAAGLPRTCGVNIPYQINPNIDCSRVR